MSMFCIESQFVYVVTNTHSMDFDMAPFINMAHDGYNLAFLFNTSYSQDNLICPTGLACLATEISEVLAIGMEKTLKEEMKTFSEVASSHQDNMYSVHTQRFHMKNGILLGLQRRRGLWR